MTKLGIKRTTPKKPIKKKAPKVDGLDKLYNKVVKYLANYTCELCGVVPTDPLKYHTHHYITRTVQRLRWSFRNTMCVCAECHSELGKDPKFNTEVFTKRLGSKGLDELRRQIYTAPKADREQIKKDLQEFIKIARGTMRREHGLD